MSPISDRHLPGAKGHYLVLPVFCVSLDDDATLVPSLWVVAQQVLNEDTVANF